MGPSFHVAINRYIQVFILLILTSAFCSCSKHSGNPDDELYELNINGKSIHVEIASTKNERTMGLMYRDKLDKDHGMLFIFPLEQYVSFWMKNTKIPLSIAFINSNGVIMQIESMSPKSVRKHESKDKIKYALEMEKGWFKQNGIKNGSKVNFSSEINNANVD